MTVHDGPRQGQKEAPKIPILRPRYQGPERRQSHRHHLKCLKVHFRRPLLWRFLMSRESGPCEVSNVTSRGVRFYTKAKLARRMIIDVRFDVPVGVYRLQGDIRLRARIIWQKWSTHHEAYRTGAQFIHLAQTVRKDLARMVQEAALHSSRF
jgi:hypothetical protein